MKLAQQNGIKPQYNEISITQWKQAETQRKQVATQQN